jgi:hypothetical protein
MPVSFDFIAPARLTASAVHSCYTPGDPQSGVAIVNTLSLRWVEPAGLVAIAMFMDSQSRIGRTPSLIAPRDRQLANYLSRMRVAEVVKDLGGTHDLPSVRHWDQDGYLLELQRFDGSEAPPELARLVEERLQHDQVAAGAMHKGICEIGANVPDHSGQDHGYIAAATTYGSTRVSFAVGDAGVGLLEPLASHGFGTEAQVMAALMRGGLSRLDDVGRGRGVQRTKEVVVSGGGWIYMASGKDHVRVNRDGVHSHRNAAAIHGTLLQGEMPC